MKLSRLKDILPTITNVQFQLENGAFIPKHFHITEIGFITKSFIDCGGTIRKEKAVNLQLWSASDFDHRLKPEKFLKIIALSEKRLNVENAKIEVDYQGGDTIGKYALDFDGTNFILKNKATACLATDNCRASQEKQPVQSSCCTPNNRTL